MPVTYNVGGGGYGSYAPAPTGPQGNQGLAGYTEWAQQPFDFNQFLQQLQGFSPEAFSALANTAGGQSLTGNPYLDETYNQASQQVTDQFNNAVLPNIAAQFGGAGRTGGGLHHTAVGQASGGLTDSLAGLSNQIYGGNYQLERDRQLAAANSLYDIYNQGAGMHMQGLGLAGDLYNQAQNRNTQAQIASQANATNRYGIDVNDAFNRLRQSQGHALASAGLGADIYGMQLGQQTNMMNLIPSLLGMGQQSNLMNAQGLLQAGGLTEGYQNNALQDQINRWNFNQMSPWNTLGMYQNLVGGNYGTTGNISSSGTSSGRTTSRSRNSMFSDLLGAGLMASSFFIPGAGPAAAAAGGGPMFFSSREFKHDLGEVDTAQVLENLNGIPVKAWKYKGDSKNHIGPFAEDFNGSDEKVISVIDYLGALHASIQALTERIEALEG